MGARYCLGDRPDRTAVAVAWQVLDHCDVNHVHSLSSLPPRNRGFHPIHSSSGWGGGRQSEGRIGEREDATAPVLQTDSPVRQLFGATERTALRRVFVMPWAGAPGRIRIAREGGHGRTWADIPRGRGRTLVASGGVRAGIPSPPLSPPGFGGMRLPGRWQTSAIPAFSRAGWTGVEPSGLPLRREERA